MTPELRAALATIARELPGSYRALETALTSAPAAAQIEFARMVRAFDDAIAREKRLRFQPWRR
jgi:hypothetical protein